MNSVSEMMSVFGCNLFGIGIGSLNLVARVYGLNGVIEGYYLRSSSVVSVMDESKGLS